MPDITNTDRYRPFGGVHTDAVVCKECSTRSTLVAVYIADIPEHDADAHPEQKLTEMWAVQRETEELAQRETAANWAAWHSQDR